VAKEKKQKHFLHHPVYPGGDKALTKFIYDNLRYPEQAVAIRAHGVVMVEYDIDKNGKVVATRVLQSVGHGCDEEACRVVRLLKYDVGKNRGMHVVFHQKAKIQFNPPAVAPVVSQTQEMQVQYTITITTTTPVPVKPEEPAKPGEMYVYTINI
jgi:TonB family protein